MKTVTHILLVENSKTARAVMIQFLEKNGYKVTAAPNGLASIEAAKTGLFDVLVMDLYMPLMNGQEATKAIRALPAPQSQVPIIILTGSQDSKDEQLCLDAGVNDFVLKSDDNQTLLDVLKKYHPKESL